MPTNLYRTPSGYVFRKVIPKPLRVILGKSVIKVSCGKKYADALANYPIEAVKAQQTLAKARATLQADQEAKDALRLRLIAPAANLKPITSVTPEFVEQLRGLWLSNLDNELEERAQGLDDDDFEALNENIAEMQDMLATAMARGKVEIILPALHQFLFLRGYVLALNPKEERALAYSFLQAVAEGYEILQKRQAGQRAPTPKMRILPAHKSGQPEENKSEELTLRQIIKTFLDDYPKSQASMLKKYSVVLSSFGQIVGENKLISEIRQTDINIYFSEVHKLPPRWSDVCRQNKINIVKLLANAKLCGGLGMAHKTFTDTYRVCISGFLQESKRNYQDQGFPVTLTTEGIKYRGTRQEGEDKQRAMRPDELKRLFQGPEMHKIANDPAKAHQYWLPLTGLFTGARVNELCQLNPATDILQEPETDIWHFWITDENAADAAVSKKLKNKISKRRVPVHPTLIELGFLDYLRNLRERKATLLFQGFRPQKGRASPKAELWFRELLKKLNLRDETPHFRLVGFHSFRFTLLAKAQELEMDLSPITGHASCDDKATIQAGNAGTQSKIVQGYQGEMVLTQKLARLKRVKFPIIFFKPVSALTEHMGQASPDPCAQLAVQHP